MFRKQRAPRPYSGAEEGAPSLTGDRDDEFLKMRLFYFPNPS
jgi:hypothetical protein